VVSLRIRSSDAGDREYITDTLTKAVRKIARILGSTEERVLISVDKYKARSASLRQILDEEFSWHPYVARDKPKGKTRG
jgi:hypothetical protein